MTEDMTLRVWRLFSLIFTGNVKGKELIMEEAIVRVRPQDADLFAQFDPFDRLNMLAMPNSFALGALEANENGEYSPAGLMVAHTTEDSLCINWMGVDSSRQNKGIGEKLLLKAYEIADGGGVRNLCAMISTEYETRKFGKNSEHFFEDRLFETMKEIPPEYIGDLRGLSKLEYMKQDLKIMPKPVSLAKLTSPQIKSALAQLEQIPQASKLCPVQGLKENLDLDLSFVFLDAGEAFGGLLVRNLDACLLPVYLYSESPYEESALILNSFNAAKSVYGMTAMVQIYCTSEKLIPLMERIFADKKDRGKLLVADMDDYRAVKAG